MRKVWVLLIVLVPLLSLAAWAGLTPSQRVQVSDEIMHELVRKYGHPRPVSPYEPLGQISQNLLAQTQRRDIQYQIFVIENKEINAIALPDGRLVFFSGLLNRLPSQDPSALAFVVGHEMSHIERAHADRKIDQLMAQRVLFGVLLGNQGQVAQAIGLIASNLMTSGYSREMESEADANGLEMTRRAGYDPNGALAVFRLFIQTEKGGTRVFPTHPRPQDRYERTVQWLQARGIPVREPGGPPPVVVNQPPPPYSSNNNGSAPLTRVWHNGPGAFFVGESLSINARGIPGGQAFAMVGPLRVNMVEVQPGHYQGTYIVMMGDNVPQGAVSVTLQSPNGQSATLEARGVVSLIGHSR